MNGNSNQYMTCFTSPVTFEVIWDDGAAHDAAWRMRDGDQMPANLHSTPGFWPIGPRQLKDLKGHRESARHAGSRFRALRQKSLELRQKSTESAWICLTSETSLCWCVFFTLEDIDHWVEGLNISDFFQFRFVCPLLRTIHSEKGAHHFSIQLGSESVRSWALFLGWQLGRRVRIEKRMQFHCMYSRDCQTDMLEIWIPWILQTGCT